MYYINKERVSRRLSQEADLKAATRSKFQENAIFWCFYNLPRRCANSTNQREDLPCSECFGTRAKKQRPLSSGGPGPGINTPASLSRAGKEIPADLEHTNHNGMERRSVPPAYSEDFSPALSFLDLLFLLAEGPGRLSS